MSAGSLEPPELPAGARLVTAPASAALRFRTRQFVEFACPRCETSLRSPLKQVGQASSCPECELAYTTPGPSASLTVHRPPTLP